jgi:hypothetical protein
MHVKAKIVETRSDLELGFEPTLTIDTHQQDGHLKRCRGTDTSIQVRKTLKPRYRPSSMIPDEDEL